MASVIMFSLSFKIFFIFFLISPADFVDITYLWKSPSLNFTDFFLLFFVLFFMYWCTNLYYFLSSNFGQFLEREGYTNILFGGDLYSGELVACGIMYVLWKVRLCNSWKPYRQFLLLVLSKKKYWWYLFWESSPFPPLPDGIFCLLVFGQK